MSSPSPPTADPRQAGPAANPAWQQFWTTGAVDTFGSTAAAILAPESAQSPPLVAHWRGWMRALPVAGELLDLATGNGVVLSHLLVARPESAWRGLGVDLAQAAPDWLLAVDATQRERIAVRGHVSAESLPFESQRFSAVTSQFGIEYADLGLAVPEAVRVLQPGGSIAWVMHHASGRPASLAREELAHLAWLEQVAWFDVISTAIQGIGGIPPQPQSGTPALAARDVRSELDHLGQALRTRTERSPCPDLLVQVGQVTVHCLGMANRQKGLDAISQLSKFRQALVETRLRSEDLIAHTLDESSWGRLLEQLRGQGIRMHSDTGLLHDRGHLMGWWLHGERA